MKQTKKKGEFDLNTFLTKKAEGRALGKYAANRTIYSQGDLAVSVFYIIKGKVKLRVTSEEGREAVVAILGSDDFFGEGCMDREALRLSTATALTDCTIMKISKAEFSREIQTEKGFSEFFISHLLIRSGQIQADLVDQLFNSSERRLARTLLLLANFGKDSGPEPVLAKISQETLAEMIGTTRSRVNHFMNKFRRLGFIDYNGHIEVHRSLLNMVLHEKPEIKDRAI